MALINCPDCSTEISDIAPICVKCGRPMSPAASPKPRTFMEGLRQGMDGVSPPISYTPSYQQQGKKRKNGIGCLGVIGILILIGMFGKGSYKYEKDTTTSSASQSRIGQMATDALGCTHKDDMEQIVDYRVQGDEATFSAFVTTALATGHCAKLNGQVYITDYDLPGLTKVRPAGGVVEYWTISEWVK